MVVKSTVRDEGLLQVSVGCNCRDPVNLPEEGESPYFVLLDRPDEELSPNGLDDLNVSTAWTLDELEEVLGHFAAHVGYWIVDANGSSKSHVNSWLDLDVLG